jgi:GNAT superfamily N-acetyltransferase
MITFVKITEPKKKSEVCESVLRSLPQWFGIESAIIHYISDVQKMQTWAVYDGDLPIGFASVNQHFPTSAELHVMGIIQKYHRRGIGHQLLKMIEDELRQQGLRYLTVKTLSESRPNTEYDQTRSFYLRMDFVPLEELKTLWEEGNPCLFLVKAL